jgi:23S rRNA pseudouridine1911/1915/1917 synthase
VNEVTPDRGDTGRRLDLVLRRHLSDRAASRAALQDAIRCGHVSINGVVVSRPAVRVAAGDVIHVELPDSAARQTMIAEDAALDVLFEDAHLIIVNKPPGLIVHPSYGHAAGTLMNALLGHARSWPAGSRPSLVGRLDKNTSGLVLVAKNAAIHSALQRATAPGRARKEYLAVVFGRVNRQRGEIALRLARDPQDRRRVVASPFRGAPSVTKFERLARLAAPRPPLSLLRCTLVTGRMHQIRVHLSARGWPIVGDAKYAHSRLPPIDDADVAARLTAFSRQALHAWRIMLEHPVTGQRLTVEAPIPADMRDLLAAVGLERGLPD